MNPAPILTSYFRLHTFLFQPSPSQPIIVKIVPPEEENLYDVLVGALGITGVMVVIALIAAVVFGATLFYVRSR